MKASAAALAFSCALASPPTHAADVEAGRQKAAMCAVCHGPQGLSLTPDAPHLAGQPVLYLATQLRAYRSGTRRNEVMAVIAKPLTDDEIDNLAAWFGSLKIAIQAAP
jgi:cytochrome c553